MTETLRNAFLQTLDLTTPEKQESHQESRYAYPHLLEKSEHLEDLISVLSTTELGKELLEDAKAYGTKIVMATLNGAHGSFNDETNIVSINSSGPFPRQIATLAHELRHAQQFKNGVQLNALTDAPKDYLHSQWTIEADANVASCLVALDLEKQGKKDVMDALALDNPHIVSPFLEALKKPNAKTEEAGRAAFYGWFESMPIRNAYEKNYLRNFENRKRNASKEDKAQALRRAVPVAENINKICKTKKSTYLTGLQAQSFFDRPEMSAVTHDTYWAIYRNVRDAKGYDFFVDAKEIMQKEGNFTIRPLYEYETPSKTLAKRQTRASEAISAYKEAKVLSKQPHEEKKETPPAALLLKKDKVR